MLIVRNRVLDPQIKELRMPLVEYTCPKCKTKTEKLLSWPFPDALNCEAEFPCNGIMRKDLSTYSKYKITGNNSASTTPKKFR